MVDFRLDASQRSAAIYKNLPLSASGLDQNQLQVAAPSGCGKTQFCTMLCLLACLPVDMGGSGVRALYIDTEAAFSAHRLVGMARARCPGQITTLDDISRVAERISVCRELTCKNLTQRYKRECIVVFHVCVCICVCMSTLLSCVAENKSSHKY